MKIKNNIKKLLLSLSLFSAMGFGAQHDYSIANQTGASFRSDLNNALAAIVSNNSGTSEPSTTFAYQLWADTTTGLLKIRNSGNSAWISIGTLATANLGLLAAPSLPGSTLPLLISSGGVVSTSAIVSAQITDNTVANGDLRQSVALSVIGRTANSTGDVADIAAANDYEVLQRVGTSLGFGPYKRKYRNATTTDSISINDGTVLFSSSSFTATIPTAVGNTGKRLTLIHGGTNLTQLYTLNTTSAQTVGGYASGAFIFYTNGETLEIESDGANWNIVLHFAETDWIDNGVLVITAEGGGGNNPTKGTTDIDKCYWKRSGRNYYQKCKYHQSAVGSSTTGTGQYIFGLPIAVDTAIIAATGSAMDADLSGTDDIASIIGRGYASSNAARGPAECVLRTSTSFSVAAYQGVSGGSAAVASSTNYDLTNGNIAFFFELGPIPASGWKP